MKKPKLCTYSVYIRKGEEDVPAETLPKEEREAFFRKVSEDFLDSFMRQKGYRRAKK